MLHQAIVYRLLVDSQTKYDSNSFMHCNKMSLFLTSMFSQYAENGGGVATWIDWTDFLKDKCRHVFDYAGLTNICQFGCDV